MTISHSKFPKTKNNISFYAGKEYKTVSFLVQDYNDIIGVTKHEIKGRSTEDIKDKINIMLENFPNQKKEALKNITKNESGFSFVKFKTFYTTKKPKTYGKYYNLNKAIRVFKDLVKKYTK